MTRVTADLPLSNAPQGRGDLPHTVPSHDQAEAQATASGSGAAVSPVARVFEQLPLRRTQLVIAMLVLAALMFDGLHIQLLSFVAPMIAAEWAVTKAALGPAMAAALIGMTLGASVGGWLGDRIGPTRALVLSVIFFGITTALASASWNLLSLVFFRFVSGLGLGAASPAGIALTIDWLPPRVRTRAVALLSIAAPLGGACGAGAIQWMLPGWGWRGSFIASGVATIALAMIMLVVLPESWSFLVRKGKILKAKADLGRILRHGFEDADLVPRESTRAGKSKSGVPAGFGRFLVGTGIVYLGLQFASFAVIAWTPVFLTAKGFTLSQALAASFGVNSLGVVGALAAPFILERTGSRMILYVVNAVIICLVLLAGIVLARVGAAPTGEEVRAIQISLAMMGGMIGVGITTLWTLMATRFPVHYRATGLGFGLMMGRVGCVAILLAGGLLINLEPERLSGFFGSIVALCICSIAGTAIIDRHQSAGENLLHG